MPLFDIDIVRDSVAPATNRGAGCAYINQSARPSIAAIRELWESWFSEYPDDAKPHLRARLRGSEYDSAAFELYVHALLRAHGYSVRVHAPEPGTATDRLPEFEVAMPDGTVLDVEARVVRAQGVAIQDVIFQGEIDDAINEIPSPGGLRIRYVTRGGQQPAPRAIGKQVCAWLNSAEFLSEVSAAKQDGQAQVSRPFESNGWRIIVSAEIERPASAYRKGSGSLLSVTSAAFAADPTRSILKAIKRKASHYGKRSSGFVIALNVQSYAADAEDLEAALCGPKSSNFLGNDNVRQPGRRWGGAWFMGDGTAINKHVSAVLGCSNIHLSTVASDMPIVFHHPDARFSCPRFLEGVTHAQVVEEGITYYPGRSSRELFCLSDSWPRPTDDLIHPSERE